MDISNTNFDGPIRGEAFEGLNQLTFLDMAFNLYSTTIPSQITNLPQLNTFYLDSVVFVEGAVQDLEFLIGMPSIFECWMDLTEFPTTIPTEIGTLSTLASFSLTFCNLMGTIPSEMGNLSALRRLWLYQNQLTGTIPAELGSIPRLEFLYVEGNLLMGSMPNEICINRSPLGLISELGSDCDGTGTVNSVDCDCCTCCGGARCGDFNR